MQVTNPPAAETAYGRSGISQLKAPLKARPSDDAPSKIKIDAAYWSNLGFHVFPADASTGQPLIDQAGRVPQAEAIDAFDAHPGAAVGGLVPDGVIIFQARGEARGRLVEHLKGFDMPSRLIMDRSGQRSTPYAVAPNADIDQIVRDLPSGVTLLRRGDVVLLPSSGDFHLTYYGVARLSELSVFPAPELEPSAIEPAPQEEEEAAAGPEPA